LQENGYTVIPLRQFVAYRLGNAPPPPPRAVVITVDDAHRSVYTDMLPYDDDLIKKAVAVGYIAAFTLDRHHASLSDPLIALPRYLMTDADRGKVFARLLSQNAGHRKVGY